MGEEKGPPASRAPRPVRARPPSAVHVQRVPAPARTERLARNMSIILAGFLDSRELDGKEPAEPAAPRARPRPCPRPRPRPRPRPPSWRPSWPLLYNVPVALLVIAVLVLTELGFIPSQQGGFYCGDPALAFKFEGDTVSIAVLLSGCALAPLAVIAGVELLVHRPARLAASDARCRAALRTARTWYGEYLLSFIFNLLFMDVVKSLVGEPRPHFLDTCKPDAAVNCTRGEFISRYKCTSEDHSDYFVRDSNKSFPSGHTSLSIYLALFLFSYVQARACSLRPRLLGPTLQVLVVVWALVCSFTRMSDHRHHWWDVLAGACLGTVLATYSVVVLCRNFAGDEVPWRSERAGDAAIRRLISCSRPEDEAPPPAS